MIDEIKTFFKPSIPKFVYALALLAWQYFYNFQQYNFGIIREARAYVSVGLGAINWGNYFIRNISLLLVWIAVAVVIYTGFLFSEFIRNFIHNIKVKMTYQNQAPEDYLHLLRSNTVSFQTHFISHLLWTGGVFMALLGFYFMAPIIEKFRFAFYENFFFQMIEGGVNIDFNNLPYTIFSFALTYPFWYFYSCLVFFIFREGVVEEEDAKIADEHFEAIIDEEDQNN